MYSEQEMDTKIEQQIERKASNVQKEESTDPNMKTQEIRQNSEDFLDLLDEDDQHEDNQQTFTEEEIYENMNGFDDDFSAANMINSDRQIELQAVEVNASKSPQARDNGLRSSQKAKNVQKQQAQNNTQRGGSENKNQEQKPSPSKK